MKTPTSQTVVTDAPRQLRNNVHVSKNVSDLNCLVFPMRVTCAYSALILDHFPLLFLPSELK